MKNNGQPNGCGQPFSIGYFLAFQIIVSQIFLNLFIAILIDSFAGQSEAYNLPVKQIDIDTFIHSWSKFDP